MGSCLSVYEEQIQYNNYYSVAQRHANIMNVFRTRTNVYYIIQFELEFLDLGERHLLETGLLFSCSNKK